MKKRNMERAARRNEIKALYKWCKIKRELHKAEVYARCVYDDLEDIDNLLVAGLENGDLTAEDFGCGFENKPKQWRTIATTAKMPVVSKAVRAMLEGGRI